MVHVSQLSRRFVKEPNKVVNVGDRVKVKVLSVDRTRKRISLSIKKAIGKKVTQSLAAESPASPADGSAPPPVAAEPDSTAPQAESSAPEESAHPGLDTECPAATSADEMPGRMTVPEPETSDAEPPGDDVTSDDVAPVDDSPAASLAEAPPEPDPGPETDPSEPKNDSGPGPEAP
jgi:hypothetical protein